MSVETIVPVCLVALALAMGVSLVRLIAGPSGPDRAVALDTISIVAAGVVGLLAVQVDESAYLRVALVISLVSFLGTVALALFVQHAHRRRERDRDA